MTSFEGAISLLILPVPLRKAPLSLQESTDSSLLCILMFQSSGDPSHWSLGACWEYPRRCG